MTHWFYADENFPPTNGARDSGHAGKAVIDLEILAFATSQQRAVLTHNRRDFIQLHQQNRRHGGIIACTFDANFERLANRIHSPLDRQESLTNPLFRINKPA